MVTDKDGAFCPYFVLICSESWRNFLRERFCELARSINNLYDVT